MQNYNSRRKNENRNMRKDIYKKEKLGTGVMIQIFILGALLVAAAYIIVFSVQKGKRVNSEINGTVESETLAAAKKR